MCGDPMVSAFRCSSESSENVSGFCSCCGVLWGSAALNTGGAGAGANPCPELRREPSCPVACSCPHPGCEDAGSLGASALCSVGFNFVFPNNFWLREQQNQVTPCSWPGSPAGSNESLSSFLPSPPPASLLVPPVLVCRDPGRVASAREGTHVL